MSFLFQQEKKIGEFIHYTSIYLFIYLKRFIYLFGGGNAQEGRAEREGETSVDSAVSTEPAAGLCPTTLRSGPEQN